ncbi:hypothetical protein ZWY2020_057579 [Hordeum vulgare]|nr:hypothetical protein ZWY2020_057579 [Hordeum vulgare]
MHTAAAGEYPHRKRARPASCRTSAPPPAGPLGQLLTINRATTSFPPLHSRKPVILLDLLINRPATIDLHTADDLRRAVPRRAPPIWRRRRRFLGTTMSGLLSKKMDGSISAATTALNSRRDLQLRLQEY